MPMHATGHPGPVGRVWYERRTKESHRDTVTYEIEMLRFCSGQLPPDRSCQGANEYLYLEGFLLHYRTLLEVFSGILHDRDDDMSTANSAAWANRELTAAEVTTIVQPAKALVRKHYENISKYLQHCTLGRHQDGMRWDAAEMREGIEPIIAAFVRAFPDT